VKRLLESRNTPPPKGRKTKRVPRGRETPPNPRVRHPWERELSQQPSFGNWGIPEPGFFFSFGAWWGPAQNPGRPKDPLLPPRGFPRPSPLSFRPFPGTPKTGGRPKPRGAKTRGLPRPETLANGNGFPFKTGFAQPPGKFLGNRKGGAFPPGKAFRGKCLGK